MNTKVERAYKAMRRLGMSESQALYVLDKQGLRPLWLEPGMIAPQEQHVILGFDLAPRGRMNRIGEVKLERARTGDVLLHWAVNMGGNTRYLFPYQDRIYVDREHPVRLKTDFPGLARVQIMPIGKPGIHTLELVLPG